MAQFVFDADTTPSPSGAGRYEVTLTDRWTTGNGTCNGGYVLAAALRAAQAEVEGDDLLTVSATFLRPGVPGPAGVTTEVIRRGRRITTTETGLSQNGKEVLRATVQTSPFAARSGGTWERHRAPALPAPEDCRPAEHRGESGITITEQIEYRMRDVPDWVSGELSGDPTLEFWVRFTDGRPADLLALPFLADSFVPAALNTGAAGGVSVQLTAYLQRVPADGWVACRQTSRHLVDGCCEEDVEMWDSHGQFVGQTRQLLLLL